MALLAAVVWGFPKKSRHHPTPVRGRAAGGESHEVAPQPPRADEGLTYEHFSAGTALLASGNPAQAAVRLEKARAAEPGKASVRETLGRAYFALGLWQEAESEFRATLGVCPTNDYAHYCLSRALRQSGRHQEAEAHLKLARAMGSDLASFSGLA